MITAARSWPPRPTPSFEDWGPLDEALPVPGSRADAHPRDHAVDRGGRPGGRGLGMHRGPVPVEPGERPVRPHPVGRMTVTPDGAKQADIGPGDTAVLPRGWTGTWQIHETIRKLYVLF